MRVHSAVLGTTMLVVSAIFALSRGGSAPPVRAQVPTATPGTTIAPPRTLPPPPTPVTLDRVNVGVEIAGPTAITSMDLVFKNPTDRPQEATLLFPVPAGSTISDFTMTVNGQTLEGELLGRDEAARIYTSIVQRQRDPALLEYVGQDVVRARVFPVPPRDEVRLTLRFSQVLVRENGAMRYRLPLTAGADAGPTVSRLTITARVSSDQGVRSLFSPSHTMKFVRESETSMSATLEEAGVPMRGVFELDALMSDDAVGAGLISYRRPGEDGYFMLWLAPPLREEAVVAKDVILVIDTSGSMAGAKIVQAKAALKFTLNRLNPADRFNIISFGSDVNRYASGLRPAADAADAFAFVDRLQAEGGTNIDGALREALSLIDPARLTTVMFLTDGQPTVGERNASRILENVRTAAPANARIFVFGVGDDVNTELLDGLAVQNHGDVSYVRPEEDVEISVSTLYSRISSPQLTNVRVDMGDARTFDVYPRPMPDLFGGQTLFVTGRYRDGGPLTVRLSGQTRDGEQTFTFTDMQLTEEDRRATYLPRLWASRKVGTLLRDIRLGTPAQNKELIDEVVRLGTRYGIVTPYTSFLVQEPGATAPVVRTPAPAAGAPAVNDSRAAGGLAQATPAAMAPRPAPTAAPGFAGPGREAPEVTSVGDKSFVRRDGVWVDTQYTAGATTIKVQFAGDAYFELLLSHPEAAQYFALGERLIVVLDGVAYEVTA